MITIASLDTLNSMASLLHKYDECIKAERVLIVECKDDLKKSVHPILDKYLTGVIKKVSSQMAKNIVLREKVLHDYFIT